MSAGEIRSVRTGPAGKSHVRTLLDYGIALAFRIVGSNIAVGFSSAITTFLNETTIRYSMAEEKSCLSRDVVRAHLYLIHS